MNRNKLLVVILTLAGLVVACQHQETYPPAGIWVSTDGNDRSAGTRGDPLASLHMALRKAREMRRLGDPSIGHGISIFVKPGRYFLRETLVIRPEDSGTESSPTIICAEGGPVILSGGMLVGGWEKPAEVPGGLPPEAKDQVFAAKVPEIWGDMLNFRQLWVNGSKAERAGTLSDGTLDRILSVDPIGEEIWIPLPEILPSQPSGMEFTIHQWWAIANLRVRDMEVYGDSARLTFHQPESRIEFEHPWPAPFIDRNREYNGNSAFFLSNDIAFLNRPGEWFRDPATGMIYYWPREGEEMSTAEVIVPLLETLVRIEGNLDNPVRHVRLEGIRFEHTTWMRPSRAGHVPLQAGMFITDAYKLKKPGTPDKNSLENQAWIGRPPAALVLSSACNISVKGCIFNHLAATGVDLVRATMQDTIEGCIFNDIGGTAIQAGFFGDQNFEAHLPYDPSDGREVCRQDVITNNLITDCTNEDWGCVGISIGYARDMVIAHNEVSNLNYSGICVGWGWTPTRSCMRNNLVLANYIHHFARNMYDVGGIYTLSAQPGTVLSRNRIEHLEKAPYAHIPEHYQYIYFDEGSSYIRAEDNWTEKDKFFSNTPGPGNRWINNGPQVSEEIRQEAGLEEKYRYLVNTLEQLKQE
jgi:hypothetical protein